MRPEATRLAGDPVGLPGGLWGKKNKKMSAIKKKKKPLASAGAPGISCCCVCGVSGDFVDAEAVVVMLSASPVSGSSKVSSPVSPKTANTAPGAGSTRKQQTGARRTAKCLAISSHACEAATASPVAHKIPAARKSAARSSGVLQMDSEGTPRKRSVADDTVPSLNVKGVLKLAK